MSARTNRPSDAATARHPSERTLARHAQDALPSKRDGTVSVVVARSLLHAVEQAGFSALPLLRAARLDPAYLEAVNARLPRAKVCELCELAVEFTGDPALGLRWVERSRDTAFSPISQLIVQATTLRHSFELLARFYPLISDQPSHRLITQEGTATVLVPQLVGESACMQRFFAETALAGFFRLIRYFSAHARPRSVGFAYAAPGHLAEYERVFVGPVLFAQPVTSITFDGRLLDAPAPHKDLEALEALEALGERGLLRIAQQASYAQRVRDFLVQEGWRQQADMELCAQALDLSIRSLRRRLADEGKSYNEIANEALASVAKNLLWDKQRSIKEAAHEMGFADGSTFYRAFKRWTGITPTAYRQAQSARYQARAASGR